MQVNKFNAIKNFLYYFMAEWHKPCTYSYSFLRALAKLRKATVSFFMSFCPSAWNNSALTGRILMEIDFWALFRKSVEKTHVSLKFDKNNVYITRRRFHVYDSFSLNSS
jgi:hypothetical protein